LTTTTLPLARVQNMRQPGNICGRAGGPGVHAVMPVVVRRPLDGTQKNLAWQQHPIICVRTCAKHGGNICVLEVHTGLSGTPSTCVGVS